MNDDVTISVAGSPRGVAEAMARIAAAGSREPSVADPSSAPGSVVKAQPDRRYLLGVAYRPGRDPNIARGVDGHRDFITPDELEQTAWAFVAKGSPTGLMHTGFRAGFDPHAKDGTEGHVQVVESYIYRGPDWVVKATDNTETVVKEGDWLVGAILDETAWDLFNRGLITGWSPQGTATRRHQK